MSELLVDFITSLDGASGRGWPGFWGLEGPEYLAWLGERRGHHLRGAAPTALMLRAAVLRRGPECQV